MQFPVEVFYIVILVAAFTVAVIGYQRLKPKDSVQKRKKAAPKKKVAKKAAKKKAAPKKKAK